VKLEPRDIKILGVVLLVALIHGLIYVFLVPPWQHYDEPNHFEYTWLIANRKTLPEAGDFDQMMRKTVAGSMVDHNFFDGLGFLPDLNSTDKPIWIGSYSQLSNPPVYYLIASAPLWLIQSAGIFIPLPDYDPGNMVDLCRTDAFRTPIAISCASEFGFAPRFRGSYDCDQ
jgi:hypothetical protein